MGHRDAPALAHSVGHRMKAVRRDDLGLGLKVHRDATGISGPWADRPQVAEHQGQPRDSLRLDAENKVRQVGLVGRVAAQEMVWELRLERRDGPLRALMEAQSLAQWEHPASTPLGPAWLQQQGEPLRERGLRAQPVAAGQSPASLLFRLARELKQQPCPLSQGQLRQAKLLVPMRQQEARLVLQPGAISPPWPSLVSRLLPRLPARRPGRSACARAQPYRDRVNWSASFSPRRRSPADSRSGLWP